MSQAPPAADLAYYSRIAGEYFARQSQPIQVFTTRVEARWIRRSVVRGSRVLVVGAGGAREIGVLLDLGCEVTAVDYSAEMLEAGRSHWGDGRVRWVLADAHDLKQFRDQFDAVLCLAAINYFVDAGRAVAEMAGALRTGGLLIVSSINRDHRSERGKASARAAGSVTRHLYAANDLRDMAFAAGLTSVRLRGVRAVCDLLPAGWNRKGAPVIGRLALATTLIVEPLLQRLAGARRTKFIWMAARR
jgi:SAM-dependent methyltransferase